MDLVNDFNPKRQLVNPRPVTRPTLPCRLANPRSAADWSVLRPLRDAQHRAADWSTPPYIFSSSRLAPARHRRRPAHQGHPANWLPLSPCRCAPEGEPLWHHRATRGLPGVGYPPGARLSTAPARAGAVHSRPRDTAMPP